MLSKFTRAVSRIKADQNSAAKNFEQKVAKICKTPKDLHQHQSNFKISKDLPQRPPKCQKYLHQSSKNDAKPV